MNPEAEALFDLIQESRYCIAFTGAGVSTLSGIRDFRGKNGLYQDLNAEKIFDIEVFREDPSFYYRATRDFIYNLDEKKPSVVHRVLATLEGRGLLKAVITQNIDLLHQKAGSKVVIEVHGSPQAHRCQSCGTTMDFANAAALVKAGALPRCGRCGGALKPDITFFGENLPSGALRKARDEASQADLMLVLGSSLLVYPAASLPHYTLDSGGDIVVVNDMPTHLDRRAKLKFNDLGPLFEYLESRLMDKNSA
ncbi:MAG TPA: Sir2 family NAD-dependent protein deacetylase [Spirochaetales bacterium]|nr:Sir2 family NAD-dependent protein deacetylase [Spirochaetales bacterium]